MAIDGVTMDQRIRESFAKQTLLATLGCQLVHIGRGEISIELPESAAVLQQHGRVHGGAVMTMADTAAGYAAMSVAPETAEVLTIELKTNFLRAAEGTLRATGRVVRAGRSIIVAEADVFGSIDQEEKHVAKTLATMAVVDEVKR
ncbi:MAG: PaaI family thioesterase [Pseudomonadota bacterium]